MASLYDPETGQPKDVDLDSEEGEEIYDRWDEELLDPIRDALKVEIGGFMPGVGIRDGKNRSVHIPHWFARRIAKYIKGEEIKSYRQRKKEDLVEQAEQRKENVEGMKQVLDDFLNEEDQRILAEEMMEEEEQVTDKLDATLLQPGLVPIIKDVAFAELYLETEVTNKHNLTPVRRECEEEWWGRLCVWHDVFSNDRVCLFCEEPIQDVVPDMQSNW